MTANCACTLLKRKLSLQYMEMFALMLMWKWFYYAPNTVKEMYDRQEELAKAKGKDYKPQPFKMPPAPGNFGTSTKVSTRCSTRACLRASRGGGLVTEFTT